MLGVKGEFGCGAGEARDDWNKTCCEMFGSGPAAGSNLYRRHVARAQPDVGAKQAH